MLRIRDVKVFLANADANISLNKISRIPLANFFEISAQLKLTQSKKRALNILNILKEHPYQDLKSCRSDEKTKQKVLDAQFSIFCNQISCKVSNFNFKILMYCLHVSQAELSLIYAIPFCNFTQIRQPNTLSFVMHD